MLKGDDRKYGATLEVKQDIRLAVIKAETANITQLSRAKKWNSTAKNRNNTTKTGWSRGLDGKWRFELTTLKWNLIKVELQNNPDVAKKRNLK